MIALGFALLLASSASAAKPAPKTYPTGPFMVGSTLVSPKDVLDARAIPDMQGKPSLMVTLLPTTAEALAKATAASRMPCTLDGKPIGDSPTTTLASDHVLQLSGDFDNYDTAGALARRISGRDPLPDSENDE